MPYKDPDRKRAAQAAHYAANPDKLRARSAAWRAANLEKKRAAEVAYRAANRGAILAYLAVRYAENPDKLRAQSAAYKLAKAIGVHTADVPPDMLAVKLAIINIKRELKRHENA